MPPFYADLIQFRVMLDICADVRSARDLGRTVKINLVGWSRGAAIATWVAHELAMIGCPNCGTNTPVDVNWLGLFDAVDMSLKIPDQFMTAPPNVGAITHLVKTDHSGYQNLFPTANINPQTPITRYDGTKSEHADVGAYRDTSDSFIRMRRAARTAGVRI
ncbi:MAG: hypothetical protein HZA51_06430 [Planctomycetes bacterium]|nr:hypothetical protein [Planctomycetota bacterium]